MAISAAALCPFGSDAAEMEFTYNVNDDVPMVYGFKKKETYDVAIRIADPTLVGTRVTSMKVDFPVKDGAFENVTAWLSKELKLENKKNVPDICSVEATVSDEWLEVSFPEPYTITEEGVYVGYSFSITDLDEALYHWPTNPIAVVEGDAVDGLYVHSSRTQLKWASIVSKLGAVSSMVVMLDTDYGENGAAASLPESCYVAVGEQYPVSLRVINHGTNPLTTFTYSYAAGSYTGSGTVNLDEPVEGIGEFADVQVMLDAIPEIGTYPFEFTVDTVNGVENTDISATATSSLVVMPFVPVNRPLVEEFTGLGCGYCPRGYIAMEEMPNLFGDRFVGMAYHSQSYESGCMVTISNDNFPISVGGFPSGTINRISEMDPSLFPSVWASYAQGMPVADVDVALEWADEEMTRLTAHASARFVRDIKDAGYKLSIALVADGLKNEAWGQSNYYRGKDPDGVESPLWDLFINGQSKVYGLTFNDVVAYYKDVHGIEGSLPAEITAGDTYTFDYSIETADVVNLKGEQFINPEATVKAVAVVLDASGRPVNCNKSNSVAWDASGVDAVISGANVVATAYYDLQGRKVANPDKGIFVKVVKLDNGETIRTRVAR